MAGTYNYTPGQVTLVSTADNLVEEEIISAYVQADFDGELAGFATHLTVGARYEYTEVTSTTNQSIPQAIIWLSDNDFQQQSSAESLSIKDSASYNNFLPSVDLTVDLSDTLIGRVSLSQTLARPTYDKYFQSTTVQNPPRPTALGGEAGGSRGNVGLDPLESNNVDVSLEWYYGDQSLLSLGYYRKDVQNFVGTEIVDQTLFDLRDATSGAPGSRSGDAAAALEQLGFPVTERNLFTMTAILDNPGDFPNGPADYDNSQTFADAVFSQYDVIPNTTDPLFIFGVQQPLNTQTATIYGFEFVSQHWFGDSGLGYSLNYTTVEGDIEYDIGGDPSVDQFALQGLSDSANLALMYENYGFSARLVYNWRDDFLNQAQRAASGANRMPEFIDEYEQVDLALSYLATDNLSLTLDIINLTEEEIIHYGPYTQPALLLPGDRGTLHAGCALDDELEPDLVSGLAGAHAHRRLSKRYNRASTFRRGGLLLTAGSRPGEAMTTRAVLNNVEHKDLRVDARHSARYGDNVNRAIAFSTEFGELQKEYPILFYQDPETNTLLAHVILGFDRDENLFLDDEGWTGHYVPAILDRGPFLIGFRDQQIDGTAHSEPVIHIDMDDPRVGADDGQAVFLPHGGDTPYLERIMRTLQVIHQGANRDKTLFPLLQSMELLQPVSIEVTLSNVEQVNLNDYYTIDAERLSRLDGARLEELNKQGALSLAFFALSSLGNIQRLITLKNKKSAIVQ